VIEFGLLGPTRVVSAGRELTLPPGKQRALLALLLLHRNDTVPAERLVDAVWGEPAPATARNALQGHISALRKVLGSERIETRPPGYLLRAGRQELDIDRFEELLGAARSAVDPARRAELARDALGTFRGEPLAEFRYDAFAQAEIARLQELRLVALEERIDAELELGRDSDVVAELEGLVAAEPLRERLHELLMLALYRSGRQADALEAYRGARETLVGQLGIEPGPRLRELERSILEQDPSLDSTRQRPRVPVRRLPSPAHALIGREPELAAVGGLLLGGARLVTVTGAAGTGKTRLALEIAQTLADRFDHTVFVGLASLGSPELVASTVAASLEVVEVPARPVETTIADTVADLRLLLVLDNTEHVLAGTAFLAPLLESCPRLTVLATSRAPLHLTAEHEFPLDPLSRPAAAALFRARAQASDLRFVADDQTVDAICARLDDLPLALELAAAQTKLLAPIELLSRLGRGIDLLSNARRDAPDRQRTLRSAMDWSYDLLPADAQRLFERMSVFAGGCTLDAAEAVCGASLDTIGSVVDASLLRRTTDAEKTRFWMLETIREYGRGRLAESEAEAATRRAHASHFLDLAARAGRELSGPEQARTLAALDDDVDNLRAALAWSHVEEPAWALRIAAGLGRYWGVRGLFREARDWLDAVRDSAELDPTAGARALLAGGNIARLQGDRPGARSFFEQGVAHVGEHGPAEYAARFLTALGSLERLEGNLELARKLLEESLRRQASGDIAGDAVTRSNLGVVLFDAGDYDGAADLLEEGCTLFEEMGDKQQLAQVAATLAYVQRERGDQVEAAAGIRRALELLAEAEEPAVTGFALMVAALVLDKRSPGHAARWLGFAEAVWARLGRGWESLEQRASEDASRVALALDASERARERAAGAELTVRDALDEALSLLGVDAPA
jgi:predicted ATPase/DNA-binding SARP family transcriptional activator